MALLVLFDDYSNRLHDAEHNWSTHVFKAAIFPVGTAIAVADVNPNLAAYAGELIGGQIPAGGVTLDNITRTPTRIDFNDEAIPADPLNPSNMRKVLIYNDSHPSKAAVGFAEYGADQDLTTGGNIVPAAAGAIVLTRT